MAPCRYKVFLKNAPEPITVEADDVSLTSADGPATAAFFNFWKARDGEEDVTVAAVPFHEFHYAVSE